MQSVYSKIVKTSGLSEKFKVLSRHFTDICCDLLKKYTELEIRVTDAEGDIVNINNRVTIVEGDVIDIDSRVTALEGITGITSLFSFESSASSSTLDPYGNLLFLQTSGGITTTLPATPTTNSLIRIINGSDEINVVNTNGREVFEEIAGTYEFEIAPGETFVFYFDGTKYYPTS